MNTKSTEERVENIKKAKNTFLTNCVPLTLVVMSLISSAYQVSGQGTRFFRISGPAATEITTFRSDGTLVWSNAQPGTTYTVQTVSSLPGGTNWIDYVQLPVTLTVNTNELFAINPPFGMVLIPAGSFTMGDTMDGETNAIPTSVTVSAFYMDVNLVSYTQWQSVYSWATNHGYGFDHAGSGKAANHPACSINWYDCIKWSNARSQQAGLTPAYYTDSGLTQVYNNGDTNAIYVNWNAAGYRLPTEAEWEKAARGGLSGHRFPWGDTISESQANYRASSFSYDLGPYISPGFNSAFFTPWVYPFTGPVGHFAPNGYGLYDMAGNIWEWCWDWYGTPYAGGVDPHGPGAGAWVSISRILRGGSWNYLADSARCACRFPQSPSNAGANDLGLRCVRKF
jgi:formylglycine-generating enzyme required for sulfatase activity